MTIQVYDESVNLIEEAVKDEGVLDSLIDGISPGRKRMKGREICSTTLMKISEEYPDVLYGKWNVLIDFLRSENAFSKFPAVYIIANTAIVDTEGEFEKIFETYFGLLNDKSVMIASHVAVNSVKIVKAKRHLEPMITEKLINIDMTEHTEDHKALIKSYIIQAFDQYFEHSNKKNDIIEFVLNQLDSSSPKTKKASKQFMKNHSISI